MLFAPLAVASGCSALLGADFDHAAADGDGGEGSGDDDTNASSGGVSSIDYDGATQEGVVYFVSGSASSPWRVGASFQPYDPDTTPESELAAYYDCTAIATEGPCVISTCGPPNQSAFPVTSGAAPNLGAGVIDISGGTSPISLFDRGGDAGYAPISSDAGLWASGATVGIRGTGDDFPEFAEKLQLASSLQMSKPAATLIAGHLTYVQSRQGDLTFAWSPGGNGALTLTLAGDTVGDDAGNPTYVGTSATCTFSVGSKTATVPHAVWSHFTSPDVDVSVQNEVTSTTRIDTSILKIDSIGTVDPAIAGGYIGYALAVTLQ